ncbi:hypothetical protein D3A96_15230 [Robertkochia marina]|nr:hypothetical protein D3A96_15230 [Robertkochia marina]
MIFLFPSLGKYAPQGERFSEGMSEARLGNYLNKTFPSQKIKLESTDPGKYTPRAVQLAWVKGWGTACGFLWMVSPKNQKFFESYQTSPLKNRLKKKSLRLLE